MNAMLVLQSNLASATREHGSPCARNQLNAKDVDMEKALTSHDMTTKELVTQFTSIELASQ